MATVTSPNSSGGEAASYATGESKSMLDRVNHDGLKITLISLHGLIRGTDPELGRDADTGGQTKYVLELARELGEHDNVRSVELLTRQIVDPKLDGIYAQREEKLSDRARIVRIPFGPKRYLHKEKLWPYIEQFVDQVLIHFRRTGIPDIIHGHYADAGLAGAQLSRLLHVPFIFTGHSLGRVKQQRLALSRQSPELLEKKYQFQTRYEAEEVALETASTVVTSTYQEIEKQYQLYDHYDCRRMEVIPPGVDLEQFFPPTEGAERPAVAEALEPFLREQTKPMILALARPDERKNLEQLVHVFGQSKELQQLANLVLVMGCRDDIAELPKGPQSVLTNVLRLIDKYDLYGRVAYPKQHKPQDVGELYRLATVQRGVFINPAFTEPFGLTLLEAAATGLPIIATNDGGPRDIIENCKNGILIDPMDRDEIEIALMKVLVDAEQWSEFSQQGIRGTREHYSWNRHAQRYLSEVTDILKNTPVPALRDTGAKSRRIPEFDRIIITDLDNTLTGDDDALREFCELLHNHSEIGFGISTGRNLPDALKLIEDLSLPKPEILNTDAGTKLHYGSVLTPDKSWQKQIGFAWNRRGVREALDPLPGLYLQEERNQSEYKVSYQLDPAVAPSMTEIKRILRSAGLRTRVELSLSAFLDIIPVRGGADLSIRHLLYKWGFAPEQVLVVGDNGNDAGMLLGNTLGVVVANYSPELERLRNRSRIYFANASHARGIIEGIEFYNFLGEIRIPNESPIETQEVSSE